MWYRYRDELVNLDNVFSARIWDNTRIEFYSSDISGSVKITFENVKVRDSEFEKICKMLGLSEPEQISRCC
jgi:hypothetical protein